MGVEVELKVPPHIFRPLKSNKDKRVWASHDMWERTYFVYIKRKGIQNMNNIRIGKKNKKAVRQLPESSNFFRKSKRIEGFTP